MSNTIRQLVPLLEPQERLDRLGAAAFKRFGPKLLDLSYANPCDGPSAEVLAVLRHVAGELSGLSLQYTPYGGRPATRRAVASRLTRDCGLPFEPRDIIMTSGAMPALNAVLRALFAPDDQVIVLTPCWQDYPLYLQHLNIPVRFVPMRKDKHLDLEAIAAAIDRRTKGLLFSHPCCPTGIVYRKEEIEGLSRVLGDAEARFDTSLYLVCDEVHRQLVWSDQPFYSPLSSYARSLCIYSFGKALFLQGQRIGYVAVSPRMAERDAVRTTLERCVRLMGFGTPTSLMQYTVCDLLDHTPCTDTLAAKQACVRRTLAAYGYNVCPGDASFYVYVESPLRDDFQFVELLASQGVLAVPSTLFHDPGYFRLSLTARHDAISARLPVFDRGLNDLMVVGRH
jgi:aspartate aminotransferase